MDKISVIVPIYNVEKYLNKCVDSILNQTYKNLEILLVDDESTDMCPKICDEYALRDKRIKVIHKKNGGVSSARNAGIDASTGKFITFVDSDDYLEENMYQELIDGIKKNNAQVCMCSYYKVDEKNLCKKAVVEKNLKNLENENPFSSLIQFGHKKTKNESIANSIMGNVWRVLFSKETIGDIRFDENLVICEDLLFIIDCFKKKPKIFTIEKPLYNYVQRKTSVLHSMTKKNFDKLIEAREKIIFSLKDFISEDEFNGYCFCMYVLSINDLIKQNRLKEIKKYASTEFFKLLNTKKNYECAKMGNVYFKYKVAFFLIHHRLFRLYRLYLIL